MNTNFVEQQQMIDHYLLGKLNEQQADEFEVMCLHDQKMLLELELSEKMLAAFRRADEQNLLQPIHPQSVVHKTSRHSPWPNAIRANAPRTFPVWNYATAAAMILGICLVSSITVFSQRNTPSSAYEPQINTPIFELAQTRSASADPDYIVRISDQPEWLVLTMNLGQIDFDRYRATLLDQNKTLVWQSDGLQPNYQDALTLSLNSAQLAEGNYVVKIEGLTGVENNPVRVAEYGFQAKLKE